MAGSRWALGSQPLPRAAASGSVRLGGQRENAVCTSYPLVVHFTRDAEGWNGTSPNAQEWFAQNPVERAKIVARLMREAGDVYKRALDERH